MHKFNGSKIAFVTYDKKESELSFIEHNGRKYTYGGLSINTFNELTSLSDSEIDKKFKSYLTSGMWSKIH